MATDMQRWKALCVEFGEAREEETRLLGLSHQAGGDLDLALVEEFDAAHERTEDVKRRMDAFIAETLG